MKKSTENRFAKNPNVKYKEYKTLSSLVSSSPNTDMYFETDRYGNTSLVLVTREKISISQYTNINTKGYNRFNANNYCILTTNLYRCVVDKPKYLKFDPNGICYLKMEETPAPKNNESLSKLNDSIDLDELPF
jgi:hypothetical protein